MERLRRVNSPLVRWAVEREAIRQRRLTGGSPPWTDDLILRQYRFCNVMRRHDKVSQWIINHVLSRRPEVDIEVFLQLVAIARWINWPPTIQELMFSDNVVRRSSIDYGLAVEVLNKRRKADKKVWTGAYIVRAPSKRGGYENCGKPLFVLKHVIAGPMTSCQNALTIALCFNSVRAMAHALGALPNWGTFMSGQVVADLTYCNELGRAYDLYTWAPMGPGSVRGYNRMFGLPLKHPRPSEELWCATLQRWREELLEALDLANPKEFTLHDVQNCLCEMDKWLRVKNGEGRPRATYTPEMAF